MDTLYIEPTKSSPFVKYNIESNTLEITGECYPENAVKFFSPVFEWLNTEIKKLDTPVLTVNLNISYFNSSSSKALMNFFDMLEEAYDNGKKIKVNWIYMEENETAEECGEEFQEDLETLPFNLVVLNSGQKNMNFSDLFQKEINILTQARQLLQNETYSDNCLLPEYKLMVKHYNKLLKQTRRLVKMSDIIQSDLNELNDRLEKLSSLDGLTGIPNRRCFNNAYEKEWKQAQRNGTALSLIMVDIDYFKLFNDTYGHAAGDTCLKQVASALSSVTKRPMDIVARYGGEEFVAVLPDTNIEGAQIVAKNMRQQVEALDIAHVESKVADHVTVSIGISSIQTTMRSSHTPETLIKVADDMLYKAKSSGRNRVCS